MTIYGNPAGAFTQGHGYGEDILKQRQANALRKVIAEHGPGIARGDTNALNAYAQHDPVAVFKMNSARSADSRLAERHGLDMQQGQMGLKVDKARFDQIVEQTARAAREEARKIGVVETEKAAKKLDGFASGAQAAYRKGEEAFNQYIQSHAADLQEDGIDPASVTYENFPYFAAALVGQRKGLTDGMKAASGRLEDPDYVIVNGQVVDRNAPNGPAVVSVQGIKPKETEAEREIQRLMSIGVSREDAIKVKEGVYRIDRDPTTREVQVVDILSGQVVGAGAQTKDVQPQSQQPVGDNFSTGASPRLSYGNRFQSAPESFGVEGAIKRGFNTVSDAVGAGALFDGVESTQADFSVMRESLLSTIAEGYQRQPPSWLMKEIRNNIPESGKIFEGSDRAQSKLKALGRYFEDEIVSTQKQLGQKLSPQSRQDLEARRSALFKALSQVDQAIDAFATGEGGNFTSSGVQWRVKK